MDFFTRFRGMLRWLHVLQPPPDPKSIFIIGFEGAGKTTLIKILANGRPIEGETPTIGEYLETLNFATGIRILTINLWMGGGAFKMWRIKNHYFQTANALIWVYSRNHPYALRGWDWDRENPLKPAKAPRPLLVLCNETVTIDPGHGGPMPSLSFKETQEQISRLPGLDDRPWRCFGADLKNGRGLKEAFSWLEDVLREQGTMIDLKKVLAQFEDLDFNEKCGI